MKLFLIEVDLPVSSACPRIRTILWTTSCFSALCPRKGCFLWTTCAPESVIRRFVSGSHGVRTWYFCIVFKINVL